MATASLRAKAKLDAVLNDPNRHDFSGCKNRIGATRHPSGGSDMINRIERRPSQTEDTGVKKMMHNILHLPAY